MTMATKHLESSSGSAHLQMDELVETNRALRAAILELTGLLRTSSHLTCSRDNLRSPPSTVLSNVPVQPTDQVEHGLAKKTMPTVSTAEVPFDAPLCRISLRRSFVEENELAKQRYIDRRNAEMLRLKHWIDYKCKFVKFCRAAQSAQMHRYIIPFKHVPAGARSI